MKLSAQPNTNFLFVLPPLTKYLNGDCDSNNDFVVVAYRATKCMCYVKNLFTYLHASPTFIKSHNRKRE